MKAVVWIVSVVAAVAFVGMGLIKLSVPADELAAMSQGVPVVLLQIAAVAEILGGLGLVLPAATRIMPHLTPLAAAGLVITMAGAIITNLIIGNYAVAFPVALLVIAAAIGWARLTRFAVPPRRTAVA